jgi:hypothetical protein
MNIESSLIVSEILSLYMKLYKADKLRIVPLGYPIVPYGGKEAKFKITFDKITINISFKQIYS